MGAWAAGSFQNDTALDWAGDLGDSRELATVRTTLIRVQEERRSAQPSFVGRMLGRRRVEPYLEADLACEGIAAAEVVAFWLGHPDEHFPDSLREWATQNMDALSPELIALARQALATIKTKSELKDLWEEGGGVAPEWHAAMADLERRLGGDGKWPG